MYSTIVPSSRDIVVEGVICDDIKVHKTPDPDWYEATLNFRDSTGVIGLLLSQLRIQYGYGPLTVDRESLDNSMVCVPMDVDTDVHVRLPIKMSIAHPDGSREMLNLIPGRCPIKKVAQFNGTLYAVTTVTFHKVKVTDSRIDAVKTGLVSYSGITAKFTSEFDIWNWNPQPADSQLEASSVSIRTIEKVQEKRSSF